MTGSDAFDSISQKDMPQNRLYRCAVEKTVSVQENVCRRNMGKQSEIIPAVSLLF